MHQKALQALYKVFSCGLYNCFYLSLPCFSYLPVKTLQVKVQGEQAKGDKSRFIIPQTHEVAVIEAHSGALNYVSA